MSDKRNPLSRAVVACIALTTSGAGHATDIAGVQWFALDQPQVSVSLWQSPHTPGEPPLSGTDILGDPTTSFNAFLDTGASGLVFSELTAARFGIGRASQDGALVTFGDVGVAGSAQFNVSTPLDAEIGRYVPGLFGGGGAGAPMATLNGIRAQIGPLSAGGTPEIPGIPGEIVDVLDPGGLLGALNDFNIVGMPAIQSRVMVMNPTSLDTLFQTLDGGLQTWLYQPNTPFDGSTAEAPGIPTVNRHVQLSFADFDAFNAIEPGDAERPTSAANPMIGSNALTDPAQDSPGVTVTYNGKEATGSFLLDTGAQSSFISPEMAAQLGVRNKLDAQDNPLPDLEALDPATGQYVDIDEFVTTVGGVGGSTEVAGFNLSSLLLRTLEGDATDADDPDHLRFLDAPVFVLDISLTDPASNTFTLDGVLGMNYLVASVLLDLEALQNGDLSGLIGGFSEGAFDWLVFDPVSGQLGLNLEAAAVPIPGTALLLLSGLLGLAARRRHPL